MPRKKANIHYLYKTTCTITGRYYIGIHSTNDLEDGYLGSGNRLRRSIRKYGEENHVKEILEFFNSREKLAEAEKKAITEEMLRDVNCMNLMSGGTGGFISVEQQRYRSQCAIDARRLKEKTDLEWFETYNKNRLAGMKKALEEGRIPNYSENYSWKGKKHTESTKLKISESSKGKSVGEKNSQFGSMWITNGIENRKVKKEDVIPDGWYKGRK